MGGKALMPSPRGDSEERGSEVRGSRQVNMGHFPTALVRRHTCWRLGMIEWSPGVIGRGRWLVRPEAMLLMLS